MHKISRYFSKRLLLRVWLPLALLTVGAYLIFGHGHTTPSIIPSSSPTKNTTSQSSSSNDKTSNTSSASPSVSDKTPATAPQAGGTLELDAAQTFVSNHTPGQNGSDTKEQSVCNTTPGATCFIKFTQGSVTKQLDSEVADSNGSAIWNWDIKDAGLTSGDWTITAVAEINGQTKTAQDQRALVIQ